MTAIQAWLVLLVFYAAPLLHVALSPKSGQLRPPPGSRCPFGPRSGWLVIVLLLGPVGWLLYMRARGRARANQAPLRNQSEGRRVGKEGVGKCRTGWAAYRSKKKNTKKNIL